MINGYVIGVELKKYAVKNCYEALKAAYVEIEDECDKEDKKAFEGVINHYQKIISKMPENIVKDIYRCNDYTFKAAGCKFQFRVYRKRNEYNVAVSRNQWMKFIEDYKVKLVVDENDKERIEITELLYQEEVNEVLEYAEKHKLELLEELEVENGRWWF